MNINFKKSAKTMKMAKSTHLDYLNIFSTPFKFICWLWATYLLLCLAL